MQLSPNVPINSPLGKALAEAYGAQTEAHRYKACLEYVRELVKSSADPQVILDAIDSIIPS